MSHLACVAEHNRPNLIVGKIPVTSDSHPDKPGVLMAGLEHVIIDETGAVLTKVSAGGLGNVAGLYVERLPCPGKFVFAKVRLHEQNVVDAHLSLIVSVYAKVSGADYSMFTTNDTPLFLPEEVTISTYLPPGTAVEFVAMDHAMFNARTKQNIYPDGRKPQEFMDFMCASPPISPPP